MATLVYFILTSSMLPQLDVSLHITSRIFESRRSLLIILVSSILLWSPGCIVLIELLFGHLHGFIDLFRSLWDISLLHADLILRVIYQLLISLPQKLLSQLRV